ncbi:Severe Depolymerization of Actin [Mycoemilia scoparia]|uniref:Protein SDA1 n=1 Tax=Mycoemilia scoparia TaxID=417184 RepID=A0A9W7ZYF2_9FUNG|nr:Severe Depolymerization of Actin [Mycoemilia scoparia]
MVVKQPRGALLALNLPQLQNLVKRDPVSYREEFLQQYRHFEASLAIFHLKPEEESKELGDLIGFLSQASARYAVYQCYPNECCDFPEKLMQLLQTHHTILNPNLRKTMVQALMFLRSRGSISNTKVLPLFFVMFRCRDKQLREMLYSHIVNDIKAANKGNHKNVKLNKTVQNFMYTLLTASDAQDKNGEGAVAAKRSLNICIELYRKQIWQDAKTVNVIAQACLSPITKIMVTAIQFFLNPKKKGKGGDGDSDDSDSDSDSGKKSIPNILMLKHQNQITKKSRHAKRKLEKAIRKHNKLLYGNNSDNEDDALSGGSSRFNKANSTNYVFGPLEQIHDPQGFVEKLFSRVHHAQTQTKRGGQSVERFEVRIMILKLAARLIGFHQLQVLNFYPFLQRYLQPHQPDVTSILALLATATHGLVPPDVLHPLVRAIADNFVADHCAPEVIAAGLNSIRAVTARQPLAMEKDLLSDLVQYRKHRDKGVMMAGRSLVMLFREINPEMLHRRERGKEITEKMISGEFKSSMSDSQVASLQSFAASAVKQGVDGAELLEEFGSASSDEDSDAYEDALDTPLGECEDEQQEDESDDDMISNGEGGIDEDEAQETGDEEEADDNEESAAHDSNKPDATFKKLPIEATRIFSQEDFDRIDELKRRRRAEQKSIEASKTKAKTPIAKKRAAPEDDVDEDNEAEDGEEGIDYTSSEEDENEILSSKAVLDESDILGAYHSRRRAKASYEERMASIQAGREGREKYASAKSKRGQDNRSTTNKEKRKTKDFKMLSHKLGIVSKGKRSLVQKQKDFRKHVKKQKRGY